MDIQILDQKGIKPYSVMPGYLDHFTIKVGQRATLIPSEGERAYGVVMDLNRDDVLKLYADSNVADYIPEEMDIVTDTGYTVNAICYILPSSSMHGTNHTYAQALYKLTVKLGFPKFYVDKIKSDSKPE